MFNEGIEYKSGDCPYSERKCLFITVSKYPCNICEVLANYCKDHKIVKSCGNCGNNLCEGNKLCDEWELKK